MNRIASFIISTAFFTTLQVNAGPSLTLARVYEEGIDITQYLVSEKLDGVRAYWDGQQLQSRQGNVFHAPVWFISGLPFQRLDGELWIARNSFEKLVSIARKTSPVDAEWRLIKYMIFDLPDSKKRYSERYAEMQRLVKRLDIPHLKVVSQYRVNDHTALMHKLEDIVAAGGEGLMLHHADAHYQAGRSSDLLKVKPYLDAEAQVIAHLPGKGKYEGMMGSLMVEMPDGKRFRIGSGFSDKERGNPPPTGSLITYKYHGLTAGGIPRFASYLRIRDDP